MKTSSYYDPPPKWTRLAIIECYQETARTLGCKPLLNFEDESFGYGCCVPKDIIETKHTLWEISDGIVLEDRACIELAIDFVLDKVYFHYSGYIKATMTRRLKSARLSPEDVSRMREGLYWIIAEQRFGSELREYFRFLKKHGLGEHEQHFASLGEHSWIKNELLRRSILVEGA